MAQSLTSSRVYPFREMAAWLRLASFRSFTISPQRRHYHDQKKLQSSHPARPRSRAGRIADMGRIWEHAELRRARSRALSGRLGVRRGMRASTECRSDVASLKSLIVQPENQKRRAMRPTSFPVRAGNLVDNFGRKYARLRVKFQDQRRSRVPTADSSQGIQ